MKFVVGIDPGLATGGMVGIQGDNIVAALTLGVRASRTSPFAGDQQFGVVVDRAEQCIRQVINGLQTWEQQWGRPELVCVETFIDLPSRAQHRDEEGNAVWVKDRWKTPLVIGMLHPFLAEYELSYQNPAILKGYSMELSMLKAGEGDAVAPGSTLLKNNHLRTAWCHAHWGASQLG